MLLQIAARHLQRFIDRLPDRIVEPGLDAEMEEGHRETGDDDCRRHGHAAEEQHQPHVQPRTGGTTAALNPDPGQPPSQHGDQQQDRDQVGQHQADADTRLPDPAVRRAPE